MKTIITITTTSDKGFNTDHKTTKHEYSEPVTVQMVKDLLDMESSTSRLDAIRIDKKDVKEEDD